MQLRIRTCAIVALAWGVAGAAAGDPVGSPTPASDADRGRMQAALFQAAVGQADKALEIYDDVLAHNPDCVEAFKLRGTVHAIKKDYARAVADCDEVIRRDATDSSAYQMKALFLVQLGKPAEALATFDKLIGIDPTNAIAYVQRGVLHDRAGHREKALADYDAALEINPKCADAFAARAGNHKNRGEVAKAVADYRAALASDGNHSEAHTGLACILSRCKDNTVRDGKEALEHAKRAVELTQGLNYLALDALASAYAELGQFPAAVGAARKALDLARNNFADHQAIRGRLSEYEAGRPCRE